MCIRDSYIAGGGGISEQTNIAGTDYADFIVDGINLGNISQGNGNMEPHTDGTTGGTGSMADVFEVRIDNNGVVKYYVNDVYHVTSATTASGTYDLMFQSYGSNSRCHFEIGSDPIIEYGAQATSTTGTVGTAILNPVLTYSDSNLPDNNDVLSVGGWVSVADDITPTIDHEWIPSGTDGKGLGGEGSPYVQEVGGEFSGSHHIIGKTITSYSVQLYNYGANTDLFMRIYDSSMNLVATSTNKIATSTLPTGSYNGDFYKFNFAPIEILDGYSITLLGDSSTTVGGSGFGGSGGEVAHNTSNADYESGITGKIYNNGWNTQSNREPVHAYTYQGDPVLAKTELLKLNDVTFNVGQTNANLVETVALDWNINGVKGSQNIGVSNGHVYPSGAVGWKDARSKTAHSITAGQEMSFTIDTSAQGFGAGAGYWGIDQSDTITSGSSNDMDYGFYIDGASGMDVLKDGTTLVSTSFSKGDVLSIAIDSSGNVVYKRNGSQVGTSTGATASNYYGHFLSISSTGVGFGGTTASGTSINTILSATGLTDNTSTPQPVSYTHLTLPTNREV